MSQQQTVIKVFDRFSGEAWDSLYDEHGPAVDTWKFIQRKLRMEELLASETPGRILDIGCLRKDHAYSNLPPIPFPFDKLIPRIAAAATRRAEPPQHDHRHWLATAYMLKARKRSDHE